MSKVQVKLKKEIETWEEVKEYETNIKNITEEDIKKNEEFSRISSILTMLKQIFGIKTENTKNEIIFVTLMYVLIFKIPPFIYNLMEKILYSFYSINFQIFYNIPANFYQMSFNEELALISYSGLIVFGIYWIRNEKNKIIKIIIAVPIAMILAFYNYSILSKYLTYYIEYKKIINFFSSLKEIHYFLILIFFFLINLSSICSNYKNSRNLKLKKIIKFLAVLGFLIPIIFPFFKKIENKKCYTVFSYNNEIKVVIEKIGDQFLVLKGDIRKNETLEEMNDLYLDTANGYGFINCNEVEKAIRMHFRKVVGHSNK